MAPKHGQAQHYDRVQQPQGLQRPRRIDKALAHTPFGPCPSVAFGFGVGSTFAAGLDGIGGVL